MDILMLSEEEVQRLLDPKALLDALAEGFAALSDGRVVAPARQEVMAQGKIFVETRLACEPAPVG